MTIADFITRYSPCKEGRDWVLDPKKNIKDIDDVWERYDLPHHWRLWLFSKFIPRAEFIQFAYDSIDGYDLTQSPRANNAVQLLKTCTPIDKAFIESFFVCKEIPRLEWVKSYKEFDNIVKAHEASEAMIIKQVERMFKRLPTII